MILHVERDRMTANEYVTYYPVTNRPMELIDGEVYMAPAPELKHQRILKKISWEFSKHLEESGTAEVILSPMDVHLSEHDVLQPDILVVRSGNLQMIENQWIKGAPDLVVEIISRTSSTRDRETKPAIYARAGVPELWLVDIKLQRIEIYQLENQTYKLNSLIERAGQEAKSVVFPDAVIMWEVVFGE